MTRHKGHWGPKQWSLYLGPALWHVEAFWLPKLGAFWTQSLWMFMKASLHGHGWLNHWPIGNWFNLQPHSHPYEEEVCGGWKFQPSNPYWFSMPPGCWSQNYFINTTKDNFFFLNGFHLLGKSTNFRSSVPGMGKKTKYIFLLWSTMSLSELWEFVMDREAWRAAIHRVAKSQTWLSDWTELNWIAHQAFVTWPSVFSRCDDEEHKVNLSGKITWFWCANSTVLIGIRSCFCTFWKLLIALFTCSFQGFLIVNFNKHVMYVGHDS